MASMDVVDSGTVQHHFGVTLNGERWFSIPQPLSADSGWGVDGPDGSRLSFHLLLVDWAGDVNGLMTMRIPLARFARGQGITLRVTGESAGSPAWYMTFTQPVAPTIDVAEEQALIRSGTGVRQGLRVRVWSLVDGTPIHVGVGGVRRLDRMLALGWNTFDVPIAQVARPTTLAVTAVSGTDTVRWAALRVDPVIPRTIYLIPHSHLDIGYNVLQKEAEFRHLVNYDEGMALARKTASYPADARFHWNVEGLWPVEGYLTEGNAAERDTLLTAARNGDLSFNGFYANLMTGLSRPEELFWALHYAKMLRTKERIPITTAITSDVPGFTWGVVPALAQSGIRYLSSGPNYQATLPGRGDRIGRLLLQWGDSAFYWMSPSDRDSVLVMVAGRGYSWFHGRRRGWPGLADEGGLIDYMDTLTADGYRYDIVQVRYTTGDNGSPDPLLPDAVRRWNATYASPHVVIATLPMLFQAFEHRYGPRLSRMRGDLTGYWEDGAGSTARETGESRMAAERLTQAGTLFAMLRPKAYSDSVFWQGWRQVLLYSEHTWGADRSISAPDDSFTIAQWRVKRGFADSADRRSRVLLAAALGDRSATPASAIDVYNTASWPRSEVVTFPDAMAMGSVVTTADGHQVPSQRLANGDLALMADSIPAFGSRRYRIEAGLPRPAGTAGAAGDSLWSGEITARVDTITGAITSVRWRGHELVDIARGGWDDYRYVLGRSSTAAVGVRGISITIRDAGPLVASIEVTSAAPGAERLTHTYRVTSGSNVIEMTTLIDKSAVRAKEGVHLGFPFLVPHGQVRIDEPWAIVRPDSDQMAGADRNVFSVGRWADVANDSVGITWATLDAPLLELGGMTAEDWHGNDGTEHWLTGLAPTQLLYSYVMNNYWHTNFKADQPGSATFRYAVRPHGPWDAGAAERFGIGMSQPLVVAPVAKDAAPPDPISVNSDQVIVSSVTPTRSGLIARVFNPTDRARRIRLRWERHAVQALVPALGVATLSLEHPPLPHRRPPVR
ncbi:MAG: hypothetical protein ACHQXA_08665 [Gemmatimonadales bacterium]